MTIRLGSSNLLRQQNLNTAFKMRLIPYVTMVTKLNLQFIFSCTLLFFTNKRSSFFSILRNLDGNLFKNTYSLLKTILFFCKEYGSS